MVRGLPWCETEFVTVPADSLVSRCLCEAHNRALSSTDAAAVEMKKAIQWMNQPGFHPGEGPDFRVEVDGFALAKWFAKCACGHAAASQAHVPLPLIRYAFAEQDDLAVGVYFAIGLHAWIGLNDGHVGTR